MVKSNWLKTLPLMLMLLVLPLEGCLSAAQLVRESANNTETEKPQNTDKPQKSAESSTTVLTTKDGQGKVNLPKGWSKDQELNDEADLQASNRSEEMYMIVLTESKKDFRNITLAKHSELTRGTLLKSLTSPKVEGPTQLTINNYPAVQYEIHGGIDNINAAYLHTTVETENNFHQILVWTLESQFSKNRDELQQVTQSFQEAAASTPAK